MLALLVLVGLLLLAARPAAAAAPPTDPYQGLNRIVFEVNVQLYAALGAVAGQLAPVSLPPGVGESVHNVFRTLREPVGAAAAVLTGDLATAANATARFAINATWGVLGTNEVASGLGYPAAQVDLGTELCRTGWLPDPAYLVLPLIGPTNIGDLGGQIATNVALRALLGAYYVPVYLPYYVLDRVDLYTQRQAAQAALPEDVVAAGGDPYLAQRAGYLARRARRCGPVGGR